MFSQTLVRFGEQKVQCTFARIAAVAVGVGFPHHLPLGEKYRSILPAYQFNNFPSHSEGETHLGGSYRTLRPPLSEVRAPVSVYLSMVPT